MASYAPSSAGKFSGRVPPGPGVRDTVPGRATFTGPGRSTSRGAPNPGIKRPAQANPGQMTPNILAQMARRRLGG